MKKTLIAAAVLAGMAGTAHAQSSVTLYGIMDMGYLYSKTEGMKARNALDSGLQSESRFGLRGSEDLGNGLKANFLLEAGINADDGTSSQSGLFNRQSWVGLSSNTLGEIRLGRQFILGSQFFTNIDPFGTTFRQAGMGSTFIAANQVRNSNSVMYFSPTWNGFQGAIGYSFNRSTNESPVAGTNNRAITSGLRYANGPIEVALTYDQVEPSTGGNVGRSTQLGGTYDFGVVKLHAAIADQRNVAVNVGDIPGWNGRFAKKTLSYMVGASAPVGTGSLFGSYQKAKDWDIEGFSVGYTYPLSRRTNAYAFFSNMDNVGHYGSAVTTGDKTTRQFGVGLRHMF
ncbi:porin [Pigmentiphaga sp. H8]|uniref:porin n=1 Tax=unclassified Pigmentiphaga TaxID=2626614 RepID=UPI000F5AA61E|nr:porin [Pigmentiphaga sp. H8]AZG10459.1 porin [Pigmentiphaga sp. H8]